MTETNRAFQSKNIETSTKLETEESIQLYRSLLKLEPGDSLPELNELPERIDIESQSIIDLLTIANRYQRIYQGFLPIELFAVGYSKPQSFNDADRGEWKMDKSGVYWRKAQANEGLGLRALWVVVQKIFTKRRSTSEPLDLTRLIQSGQHPPFWLHNHPATSGATIPNSEKKLTQERLLDQRNVFPLPSGVDTALSITVPGTLLSIIGCRPFNSDETVQLAVVVMLQTSETRTSKERNERNRMREDVIKRAEAFLSANYTSHISTDEKENHAHIWRVTFQRLQEIARQYGLILMAGYAEKNVLKLSIDPGDLVRHYLSSTTLR